MINRTWVVFGLLLCSAVAHAQEADYATLHVRVNGINNRPGEIGVALFNSPKGYPTHIDQAYEPEWVPLQAGQQTVDVEFDGLPPGEYAVSVVHDANGTRKLERTAVGFPKEGVGFSNDQHVVLSAPKFRNAKFLLAAGEDKHIAITLEYRD